jgi:hypothetical protein
MPLDILITDASVKAIRLLFSFDTPDIGTGVQVGTIPINSQLVSVRAHVVTPFNAGSSNFVRSGFSASATQLMVSADVGQAAGTVIDQTAYAMAAEFGGNRTIWVRYTHSGGAPTEGSVLFVAEYVTPQFAATSW